MSRVTTVVRPAQRVLQSMHPDEPDHPNHVVHKEVVSADDPYTHIIQVPPGHRVLPHPHDSSEVTVVLSGVLLLDGDPGAPVPAPCGPGTVIVTAANDAYAFTAAPDEPLVFAVIRPRPSTSELRP